MMKHERADVEINVASMDLVMAMNSGTASFTNVRNVAKALAAAATGQRRDYHAMSNELAGQAKQLGVECLSVAHELVEHVPARVVVLADHACPEPGGGVITVVSDHGRVCGVDACSAALRTYGQRRTLRDCP